MELLADPMFMAVAVIGVCLLGISKGGFLGLGVMALPLMSLWVPPLQAAAIILPTAIAQDFLTLWVYRREWSAWNIKIMLPSMIVGMFGAYLIAASLSAAQIRLAIGLIAALFVLRHWLASRFERYAPKPSVATGIAFGALGGVTTMLANAGGPAWQIHLLPQKLEKLPYIGTLSILFASSNLVKVPSFATLGYLTRDNLMIGLTLVPIALLANFLGIWTVRRVSTEMFYRIAYVLMFIIAVELIRSSVLEMWWR
ncbi:MAG: sulfite exporter TauE/SafE family protein [Alphaproteobacteria bacterium]|nr:sulfite exporter TauE/SafE family protein [Alphaproteobacteria bacterium]